MFDDCCLSILGIECRCLALAHIMRRGSGYTSPRATQLRPSRLHNDNSVPQPHHSLLLTPTPFQSPRSSRRGYPGSSTLRETKLPTYAECPSPANRATHLPLPINRKINHGHHNHNHNHPPTPQRRPRRLRSPPNRPSRSHNRSSSSVLNRHLAGAATRRLQPDPRAAPTSVRGHEP